MTNSIAKMAPYTIPGVYLKDIKITVPLDWSRPAGETISVFAREAVAPEKKDDDLPLLAFLQGGPGGKSPRPGQNSPEWLSVALKTHRVVLIDQRGTGRSSAVQGRDMERFENAETGASFLAKFRADSIIRDCEHIRKSVYGGVRWETLGQSYGGFLTLSYLSMAPEALTACYITGGLAGLTATADDVYERTFPRVAAKTRRHYARYPGDVSLAASIASTLFDNDVRLPDGDRLTVRRFQTLGLDLGMAPGFENMHWLLDEAFAADGALSETFLHQVMMRTSFVENPLFVVLQEAIYGQHGHASRWAAERKRADFPEFSPDAKPLLFTGEMMFPWMMQEIRALRPFKAATDELHEYRFDDPLYDLSRLASNAVPVAASVYYDDMYVDAALSLETASMVGNMRTWVTNEYEHDGLRQSGRVLQRLMDMARDKAV